ncbi:MAG: molybdopterin molybdotransferase MoeA [Oxalobacter formigenes]|nr:molybdopterin molybdotransferase MoeA [Oxalobacter formigenes]
MAKKQSMLSTGEALAFLADAASVVAGTETVDLSCANGRVLAEPVFSGVNVPNTSVATMDGYAVRSRDCRAGNVTLNITQRIPAGMTGHALREGETARIFTGASLPEGADAVVRQEDCQAAGGRITFSCLPHPGDWIRPAGKSLKKGMLALEEGTYLKPHHVGLAASAGCAALSVVRRLRVAFFSTGNEVLMPGELLGAGQVYNANRSLIGALLENYGCIVTHGGNVPDDREATRKALACAAERHDLVLVSGGMSVGEEDHVRAAVEALGCIRFWQVAVKPGKPLAYGEITCTEKDGNRSVITPFIGLPGNPVSSFVTFLVFVRPFLLRRMGIRQIEPVAVMMRADFLMDKAQERNEFLRARVNRQGGLDLFDDQGSGAIASLAWCDGLIDNPPGNRIRKGDIVRFLPLNGLIYP